MLLCTRFGKPAAHDIYCTGREADRSIEYSMTNEQYNARLEALAKLIEASAKTADEAARIVRDAKTTSRETRREK